MNDQPTAECSLSEGVATAMRVSGGVWWPSPKKVRRVGWLDQKGRVWTDIPDQSFDGGSLMPLLVSNDDD